MTKNNLTFPGESKSGTVGTREEAGYTKSLAGLNISGVR
jgi:hypothetical protein